MSTAPPPPSYILPGCVAAVGLFALGVWGYWPLLSEEHARQEPWRAVASWVGEACGLAWLAVFAWRHGVRGRPLRADTPRGRRAFVGGAAVLVLGFAGDLAVTGSTILEERRGHARSIKTVADAAVIRGGGIVDVVNWRFRVTFRDAAGRVHTGVLDATDRPAARGEPGGFGPGVSHDTAVALRAGRRNFRVPVRYDPLRPSRCWLAGEAWNRGNAVHWVFALVHVFQVIAVCTAVASLAGATGVGGASSNRPHPLAVAVLPVLPFLFEAAVLGLFGVLYRVRGF